MKLYSDCGWFGFFKTEFDPQSMCGDGTKFRDGKCVNKELSSGTYAIKANDSWCSHELYGVQCTHESIDEENMLKFTFDLKKMGYGHYSISHDNDFCSDSRPIRCNNRKTSVGPWEKFEVTPSPDMRTSTHLRVEGSMSLATQMTTEDCNVKWMPQTVLPPRLSSYRCENPKVFFRRGKKTIMKLYSDCGWFGFFKTEVDPQTLCGDGTEYRDGKCVPALPKCKQDPSRNCYRTLDDVPLCFLPEEKNGVVIDVDNLEYLNNMFSGQQFDSVQDYVSRGEAAAHEYKHNAQRCEV